MRTRGNLASVVGTALMVAGCSTARLAGDGSPVPGDGDGDGAVPGADSGAGDGGPGFTEAPPNEPDGALCDIPPDYIASGGDPYRPRCAIAVGVYRDPAAVPKSV